MRIGKGVLDDAEGGALLAFKQFLRPIVEDAIKISEHARRMIITASDVAMSLKRRGM